MLLLPTVLTGSLFGYNFGGNVFWAFVAGFVSYFLINLIPHWHPENRKNKYLLIIQIFDFILSAAFMMFVLFSIFQPANEFVFSVNNLDGTIGLTHFFGLIGAILPFFAFIFIKEEMIGNKILRQIFAVSKKVSYQDRSFWGIFVQIALVIVCITLVFRLVDFPSWQKIVIQLI